MGRKSQDHKHTIAKLNRVRLDDKDFVKSKYSPKLFWNGACVAVARKGGVVAVRDTKQPEAGMLRFTQAEWDAFVRGVKDGDFDV